ncbi:hypothetical protein [Mycobacterium sp. C31M]
MDHIDEIEFAHRLLDVSRGFLDESSGATFALRIGAGQQRRVIHELLAALVGSDTALHPALAGALWAWMNRLVGTGAEAEVRGVATRIRLSGGHGHIGSTPWAGGDANPVRGRQLISLEGAGA